MFESMKRHIKKVGKLHFELVKEDLKKVIHQHHWRKKFEDLPCYSPKIRYYTHTKEEYIFYIIAQVIKHGKYKALVKILYSPDSNKVELRIAPKLSVEIETALNNLLPELTEAFNKELEGAKREVEEKREKYHIPEGVPVPLRP